MSTVPILRQAYRSVERHNPTRFGAALAFFFVFTIGPALLIAVSVAARILGRDEAQRRSGSVVASFFGSSAATAVAEIVAATATPNAGLLAVTIGFLGLYFGVSGMYRQIRDALRIVWHIETIKPVGWIPTLIHQTRSIVTVLAVTLLLFISALADTAISLAGKYAASRLRGGEALWHLVQLSLSLLFLALIFGLIFQYLPGKRLPWREVAMGALVTAALFVAGKFCLGLYLGKAAVGSRYGAAGSIVVLMVWAYWSAQIFFFGLELTHTYSESHHAPRVADRRQRDTRKAGVGS